VSQNSDDGVLTLERGAVKVAIAEALYQDLMNKVHLAPGGYHSAEAAYWLHLAAKRRGLTALASELDKLYRSPHAGPVLVRERDGHLYRGPSTATQVTQERAAANAPTEQDLVTADIHAFLGVEE
jgi:hypothetical protein